MKPTVPSATPPQLASVGQCVTSTPRAVAASRSTSSTPMVYLETMRNSGNRSRKAPSMGARLTVAPISASAPRASSNKASRSMPERQDVRPTTTSHPASRMRRWESPEASTGM